MFSFADKTNFHRVTSWLWNLYERLKEKDVFVSDMPRNEKSLK